MLDVIAILGLAVAVAILVWAATYGNCSHLLYFWCKCCKRCPTQPPRDTVVIQVDLKSGAVRTYHNSLTTAFSQSAMQVTQVSTMSQTAAQNSEENLVTPTTPTLAHASSHVSTSTQTTHVPPYLNSSTSITSEYSTEVAPLDKSMWTDRSPGTSSQADDSTTLIDSPSDFINATYFEESTEAASQINDFLIHLDSPDGPKTREVIELDRFVNNAESPDMTRSSVAPLDESDSFVFPDLSSGGPPCLELKDIQSHVGHSYHPPVCEEGKSEFQGPESDRESYYTCHDPASEDEDEEEETPIKRKISDSSLCIDDYCQLNSAEDVV